LRSDDLRSLVHLWLVEEGLPNLVLYITQFFGQLR
jgi:hypothetical protein